MSNSQARVEDIFAEAARLFENKNREYGDSWRNQGWRGNVSRILEKAARVRTMVWRGGNVLLNGSKEHPRETMLDMINTLAFAIINMDDSVEWGNEPQATVIQGPGLAYVEQLAEEATLQEPDTNRQRLEDLRVNYAMSIGKHPDRMYAEEFPPELRVPEDQPMPPEGRGGTQIQPHVGNVPTPGEEPPSPRPRSNNNRKRANVTDRGSQPRPVPNTPQA